MWVIRLAHSHLNKFRVIAERTREAAQQRAVDQIDAWDHLCYSSSDLKRLFAPEQRNRQLAQQLTAQVQEELATLRSLLLYGTLVEYNMTPPAPPKPEDAPPEPCREAYIPHLSFADYLIPPVRKRKETEASERFAAAHSEWERVDAEITARNREKAERYQSELARVEAEKAAYRRGEPAFIAAYCRKLLNASTYPCIAASIPSIATHGHGHFSSSAAATEHSDTFPCEFELDYSSQTRTVVVEYELPPADAMPSVRGYRYLAAGGKVVPVPAPRSSMNEVYELVLYQAALRTIYELLRWDEAAALESVTFNGWVSALDNATGRRVHTCILSIQAGKKDFLGINLPAVDPKACFRKLKGISGAKLAAMSPVRPILQINRADKRFINARPVVEALDNTTNLAAMDWEDFEQLIRDIFEAEFSGDGGEVKITRASRDHGVDAVAFDPDPIRGGKIVIQAKRYTNTVSVSAVRDLYGTILNEGANKGILVTTADYGADAYEFAKGKPITLLNGSELLYLLQKHGHKARIDLAEARRLAAEQDNTSGR